MQCIVESQFVVSFYIVHIVNFGFVDAIFISTCLAYNVSLMREIESYFMIADLQHSIAFQGCGGAVHFCLRISECLVVIMIDIIESHTDLTNILDHQQLAQLTINYLQRDEITNA